MSASANTVWARTLLGSLRAAGVTDVCVAPGSRSTPLVMAAAAEGVRIRVHLDERSAAFFALGVGKATGRPAVLVTTSGTAAANALPAVVEAARSASPLLVLTADRPHHYRDADANQAIDQVHLFGRHARAFFDLAAADRSERALRHLASVGARAVAEATAGGPVHVNVPFEKPLEPSAEPLSQPLPTGPVVLPAAAVPGPEALDRVARMLDGSERCVIVAGPGAGPQVLGLGSRTGFPVLADPLSGARYGPKRGAVVLGAYDLFLGSATAGRLDPDLIVRFGSSPTSSSLLVWLERHRDVEQIVVGGGRIWKDHLAAASLYVTGGAGFVEALCDGLESDPSPDAARAWMTAERVTHSVVAPLLSERFEGALVKRVFDGLDGGETLCVGSSMPVRYLDAFVGPSDAHVRVIGNRGASGIDGFVSTTLGVAAGTGEPVTAVLGDLTFLHDTNGLLAARERDVRATLVVLNNDGGGIFHRLPIAAYEPEFTEYFATPHGLELRHASELHGLRHEEVEPEGLARALEEPGDGVRVVEVKTERTFNEACHREIEGAVEQRLTRESWE